MRLFFLLFYLALCFLFSVSVSFGQGTIKGVIVEENEKGELSPLIGANVIWLGTTIGASADTNGVFSLPYNAESRRLLVSYIGYRSDTILVETPEQLTIILKNSQVLDEVQVIYRKKSTEISYMDVLKTEIMGEQELFKAACCNLSESFETNPSVDVSFTDALTGTRQIQMLGLAGPYVQISQENIPYARGIATIYGLTYIPGSWMSSIQVAKGMGPVVNGFESIAGQINVEIKKPEEKQKLFINVYGNQEGRMELNLFSRFRLSNRWSTALLLHGKTLMLKSDNNSDSFLDVPLSNQFIAMSRWKYVNPNGLRMQFGAKGIWMDDIGGQVQFQPDRDKLDTNNYGVGINTNRIEGFAKLGYIFPKNKFASIGLQISGINHKQESYFGLRRYDATQESGYANLIFQSLIGNTQHKIKGGSSYLFDRYDETLDSLNYKRTEIIPGVFVEYTYAPLDNITLVAGLRADHHNYYGSFLVPRVHFRYCMAEKTVFRGSIGKGWRTTNIIAENLGMLASSRHLILISDSALAGFGFKVEEAWSYGFNITQEFTLDYRDGSIGFDYYRTDFKNQLIVDFEQSSNEVWFYNLEGDSYSNSLQLTFNYELIRRLDIRLAYRWFDVKMSYGSEWNPADQAFQEHELKRKPLMSVNRAFINLAYATKRRWNFDCTVQWQGEKRIPEHPDMDIESPSFFIVNSQITKNFVTNVDFYVGVENIANFRQENPIISSENPFSENFDSSLIWGPIFGRMAYVGFRYSLE